MAQRMFSGRTKELDGLIAGGYFNDYCSAADVRVEFTRTGKRRLCKERYRVSQEMI